jgi:hypothetical protein
MLFGRIGVVYAHGATSYATSRDKIEFNAGHVVEFRYDPHTFALSVRNKTYHAAHITRTLRSDKFTSGVWIHALLGTGGSIELQEATEAW